VEIDFDQIVRHTVEKLRTERLARQQAERGRCDGERKTMRKSRFSQAQLAAASGVHPRTVNKFLRGQPIRSDAAARLNKTMKKLGVVNMAESGDQDAA
jgi:hypothetical protein